MLRMMMFLLSMKRQTCRDLGLVDNAVIDHQAHTLQAVFRFFEERRDVIRSLQQHRISCPGRKLEMEERGERQLIQDGILIQGKLQRVRKANLSQSNQENSPHRDFDQLEQHLWETNHISLVHRNSIPHSESGFEK